MTKQAFSGVQCCGIMELYHFRVRPQAVKVEATHVRHPLRAL